MQITIYRDNSDGNEGWAYRIRYSEDEMGELVAVGLERTCQKVLSQRTEEQEQIPSALLTDHVRFLHLRYWSEGDWVESWDGGDLPLAVEIVLGAEALPADLAPEEYPYETFRRVVYVPGSEHGISGGVVQGLGQEGLP